MADVDNKKSKVEEAKEASRQLRGSVAETLASGADSFEHDDIQVLKFHGIYQQDNRDDRKGKAAGGKQYWFMIRTKHPGGRLSAEQYLGLDRIADQFTYNRSIRITDRQAIQFHGIIIGELKTTMATINQAMVSTIAACGDVERNVMSCPAPLADPAHQAVQALAEEIASKLCPQTRAYYEIWLDGEKVVDSSETEEPFYGPNYLPRKFKTGIALPEDNSVDVYSQDCGLIAIIKDGQLKGCNLLVGGGFGMTHRKEDTFARTGSTIGYVDAIHAADAVKTVVGIFRDHGNRSDRRHARLKYLIEEWGIEKFQAEFRSRAGFELKPAVEVGTLGYKDYLGKNEQGDGKFFYGVWVENGRLTDSEDGTFRPKTAIRKIVSELGCNVVFTPTQNLLLSDLTAEQVTWVEEVLREHGVKDYTELSTLRRHMIACPALPTCGLALAESERELPNIITDLEHEYAKRGLNGAPMTVRSTGCPNGCGRPYSADVAFVGRKHDVYDIFVGGRLAGDRLADLFAENIERTKLMDTLAPLLDAYAARKQNDEALGDFYQRAFGDGLTKNKLTGSKDNPTYVRVTVGGSAN